MTTDGTPDNVQVVVEQPEAEPPTTTPPVSPAPVNPSPAAQELGEQVAERAMSLMREAMRAQTEAFGQMGDTMALALQRLEEATTLLNEAAVRADSRLDTAIERLEGTEASMLTVTESLLMMQQAAATPQTPPPNQ